jgi:tetratricopeptide (TPR) repeat protein
VVVVPPASSSRNLYWLVAALAVVALASLWAMWLQRRDAYVEFLNEADQYSHAGMWLDAINWYDMALAKNPPVVEQAVIYDLRCQANAQAGMAEDALTDCLRAIRIGPANFKARLDTAALYAGAKQPDKALEQYQAALAIAVKAGDLPGQQIAKAKIGAIGK